MSKSFPFSLRLLTCDSILRQTFDKKRRWPLFWRSFTWDVFICVEFWWLVHFLVWIKLIILRIFVQYKHPSLWCDLSASEKVEVVFGYSWSLHRPIWTMESAFGAGKAGMPFDPIKHIQKPQTIVRLLCWVSWQSSWSFYCLRGNWRTSDYHYLKSKSSFFVVAALRHHRLRVHLFARVDRRQGRQLGLHHRQWAKRLQLPGRDRGDCFPGVDGFPRRRRPVRAILQRQDAEALRHARPRVLRSVEINSWIPV